MQKNQQGFTLIEIMVVVVIIGILAVVAVPSYQRYVIKTKRVDMMTELQNIANTIESKKLALGSYNNIQTSDLALGDFPRQGTALYTITASPMTSNWVLTAVPKSGSQIANDGTLTLSANGTKCREITTTDKKCGSSWND